MSKMMHILVTFLFGLVPQQGGLGKIESLSLAGLSKNGSEPIDVCGLWTAIAQ